jgi:hypothetical protein
VKVAFTPCDVAAQIKIDWFMILGYRVHLELVLQL